MSIKEFYTVKEIANMLNVHWQTVLNYIKAQKLQAFKMGKGYRIRRKDIMDFIKSNTEGSISSSALSEEKNDDSELSVHELMKSSSFVKNMEIDLSRVQSTKEIMSTTINSLDDIINNSVLNEELNKINENARKFCEINNNLSTIILAAKTKNLNEISLKNIDASLSTLISNSYLTEVAQNCSKSHDLLNEVVKRSLVINNDVAKSTINLVANETLKNFDITSQSLVPLAETSKALEEGVSIIKNNIFGEISTSLQQTQLMLENLAKNSLSVSAFGFSQEHFAADHFQKILDTFSAISKETKETRKILISTRWWFSPMISDLPFSVVLKAVRESEANKQDMICELVEATFKRKKFDYDVLLKKWLNNSLFKKRKHLLEQSLNAHQREDYAASITLSLTQIEGIAGDFCKGQNIILSRHEENRGNSKIVKMLDYSNKSKEIPFKDVLLELIEDMLFADNRKPQFKNKFKNDYNEILNRHSILHGKISGFDTKYNSYRCILLLDILSVIDLD